MRLDELKKQEKEQENEERCLNDVKRLVDAYPLVPE